jgi:spore coat protein CotF
MTMNDKNLMENLLLLEKGVCDLFLHGTIESGTENVHQAFQTALNASLNMQDSIYDEMTAKGWYPTQQVEQKKIDTVRQKFSAQSA